MSKKALDYLDEHGDFDKYEDSEMQAKEGQWYD